MYTPVLVLVNYVRVCTPDSLQLSLIQGRCMIISNLFQYSILETDSS